MKTETLFLNQEQVLRIHAGSIQKHGGLDGLRDAGLLASALSMPQAKFGGQFLHDGISAMAAAYLFHLCKNHPFADGNKRTAHGTAVTFLLINGYNITTDADETERMVLRVADGTISKQELTKIFSKIVKREKT